MSEKYTIKTISFWRMTVFVADKQYTSQKHCTLFQQAIKRYSGYFEESSISFLFR
jgi:hypothetical protein